MKKNICRVGKFNYSYIFYAKKIKNNSYFLDNKIFNTAELLIYDNLLIKNNLLLTKIENKIKNTLFYKKNNNNNLMYCISFYFIEKYLSNNNKNPLFKKYIEFLDFYNKVSYSFFEKDIDFNKLNIEINNLKQDFYNSVIEYLNKQNDNLFINYFLSNISIFIKFNINEDKIFFNYYDLNYNIANVIGKSKGKGFQGVVKRYNFSKGPASHGSSLFHNRPGAIGTGLNRVIPGTKLPGRTGGKTFNIKNLKIIKNKDYLSEILILKGSVPGYKSNLLQVVFI
jgi:hypothetical protein